MVRGNRALRPSVQLSEMRDGLAAWLFLRHVSLGFTRYACELITERAFNFFRMSFAADDSANIGTIHIVLSRHSAVETA